MHGLINRSIQNFVCDSLGLLGWIDVVDRAESPISDFEGMLVYDDVLTPKLLDATAQVFDLSREEVMEDIGTFLVSHPTCEAIRRLLRFGGVNFEDFLHSLDDLPDRARLAVPDLDLPGIELRAHSEGQFSLVCKTPVAGFGHVMIGILRVMADDYGALALLEHTGRGQGVETVSISLVEAKFAEGRAFELGAQTA